MATLSAINNEPFGGATAASVEMKFEVVVIPVTDVDRSKAFYTKLGWRLDADFPFDNGFRVVQFTPPGSGCSVQFGTKMTTALPGSAQGLYLIVSDVEARARNYSLAASKSVKFFIPRCPVPSYDPTATVGSAGWHPTIAATFPLPHSMIPTATPGYFRKSPRGCPDEDSAIRTLRR
jgi:catechol 2,3-dioxygenase-like lactoylglutathione lyase family enzyme